jgi:hypothetical protein
VAVLTLLVLGGTPGVVRADSPPAAPRGEAARQALLDQIDDARINRDLLELEVEALRVQVRNMMFTLRECEMPPIPGIPQGSILGGDDQDRAANIKKYRQMLDRVCGEFAHKSKELFREQRRVAALGAQLGTSSLGIGLDRESRLPKDAERLLDLIRQGIESWRRDPAREPEPRPAPRQRPESGSAPDQELLKDAERLLDLIRRGVEAWQARQ